MNVNENGCYVFKVTLSDRLFAQVQNQRISSFKFYELNVSGDVWEIFNTSGEKLQTFTDRQIIMAKTLTADIPCRMYIAKTAGSSSSSVSNFSGSSGGCDSGFRIFALLSLLVFVTLKKPCTKIFILVLILFSASSSISYANENINPSDYALPIPFEVYTPSGTWTTDFELTDGLVNTVLAELGRGLTRENIHSYSEIALPESWDISAITFSDLANSGYRAAVQLPLTENGTSNDLYVVLCELGDDIEAGEIMTLAGLEVDLQMRETVYDEEHLLTGAYYVFLDEDYKSITKVPENKKVYVAVSFSPEYVNTGVLAVIRGTYITETDPLARLDDEVARRIAAYLQISVDDLTFLSRLELREAEDPTEDMKEYVQSDNHEIISNLYQVSVDHEGAYVFQVVLSEDTWAEVKNKDVSNYKVYALNDDPDTVEIQPTLINGLIGTWEIFTLSGERLEKFGVREFLMVAVLDAGKPLTLYLAKVLLRVLLALLGGCNSGIIFTLPGAMTGIILGGVILKIRRK